eukprot:1969555-Amphidinium_carterae.1
MVQQSSLPQGHAAKTSGGQEGVHIVLCLHGFVIISLGWVLLGLNCAFEASILHLFCRPARVRGSSPSCARLASPAAAAAAATAARSVDAMSPK